MRIVAEAVAERPRTLAILESELWSVREWRSHRQDWGKRGVSLVAELDGSVVGQVTCERSSRTVTMHSADLGITVRSDARGIGVGRALMLALEEWAREFGVDRITLGVFEGNDPAIGLYRSLGYVEEGVERGAVRFPDGDVDVLRMAKSLRRATAGGARRPRGAGTGLRCSEAPTRGDGRRGRVRDDGRRVSRHLRGGRVDHRSLR